MTNINHYSCKCGETAFKAVSVTVCNCYYCHSAVLRINTEQLQPTVKGQTVEDVARALAIAKVERRMRIA